MVQRRGAASYSMRDRIHVQNAKQNAVYMMCAIFFLSKLRHDIILAHLFTDNFQW